MPCPEMPCKHCKCGVHLKAEVGPPCLVLLTDAQSHKDIDCIVPLSRDLVVSMREQVRQRNPQAFQEKIEKHTTTHGAITNRLHKRGCHCKKSHCKKKYCECFQA